MPTPRWLTEVPFAHRGLHDAARGRPENSLAAFDAAAERGHGIELDVRLTADGVAVVVHDDDLEGVSGRRLSVAASTATDVAGVRLGNSGERVPTLADALDVVAGRVPVMVELKNERRTAGPLEAAVARELARRPADPLCLASFNPRTVGWFARHAPRTIRGQTASSFEGLELPYLAKRLLASMVANRWTRPDFVSYELGGLPNVWCDRWRERGRPLVTWTVRTPHELAKARVVADNVIFERVAV